MPHHRPSHPAASPAARVHALVRIALALVGWAAATGWLAATVVPGVAALGRPGLRSDDVLGLAAGAAALLICGWLGVATAVCVITALAAPVRDRRDRTTGAAGSPERAPGDSPVDRLAARITPARLRAAVATAVTVGVLGTASPALAASGDLSPGWAVTAVVHGPPDRLTPSGTPAGTSTSAPAGTGDLSPGWTPRRPPAPPTELPLPTGRIRPGATGDPAVVVHRGDTLWDIAARRLGPGADDAAIAAEWPRWYRANAALIGPDPDLLRPGTRLTPPPDRPGPDPHRGGRP